MLHRSRLAGVLITILLAEASLATPAILPLHLEEDMVLGTGPEAPIGMVTTAVVDSQGAIYLADVGFQHIQKFSPEGKFDRAFGAPGEGPGDLMIPFVMTMGPEDCLYLAGAANRIAVWDRNGTFLREFKGVHPGAAARSVRVATNGDIFLATLDIVEQTVVDVFRADGTYLRSLGESYAVGEDVDTRIESLYGGGYLDLDPRGRVAFTHLAPFRIDLFEPSGRRLATTTRGGEEFVPPPPPPEIHGQTLSVRFPATSVEVTCLGSRILNCAVRNVDDASKETLLTLYDSQLKLIGRTILDGSHVVVGAADSNRVFVYQRGVGVPIVYRAAIRLGEGPEKSGVR